MKRNRLYLMLGMENELLELLEIKSWIIEIGNQA